MELIIDIIDNFIGQVHIRQKVLSGLDGDAYGLLGLWGNPGYNMGLLHSCFYIAAFSIFRINNPQPA